MDMLEERRDRRIRRSRRGVLFALVAVAAGCVLATAFASNSVSAKTPLHSTTANEDCEPGGAGYQLGAANATFALGDYRQVHLHDYLPGTTLSTNNSTKVIWSVFNNFSPNAGLEFDFVHDYLGRDVLNWEKTSSSGAVTDGSYGVVPADFRIHVDRVSSSWNAYANYSSTDHFITSVVPSDAGHVSLQLGGATYVVTSGPCNSMDMRFDGGVPGSGSYTSCGSRLFWGSPSPLNCSKGVQIRFYYP